MNQPRLRAVPDAPLPTDPREVVAAFLGALAAKDFATAGALLAEDAAYTNVGLPTIRGRRRIVNALRLLDRPWTSFEVYYHAIAATGPVVLTERTDVLVFGPLRAQFWVTGRFDVHDGTITVWRDAFDYLDLLRANLRALAGAVVPSWRPRPPADPARTAPGRH